MKSGNPYSTPVTISHVDEIKQKRAASKTIILNDVNIVAMNASRICELASCASKLNSPPAISSAGTTLPIHDPLIQAEMPKSKKVRLHIKQA
jgi:hypothetical protein